MRVASFDLGTNTALMLVADIGDGVVRVEDLADIVRLGEGLDKSGRLATVAMERALAALTRFCVRARELGVTEVLAVGTEALRRAENGAVFVAAADDVLGGVVSGARLQIIDGEREARLSFLAVTDSFPTTTRERIVVDIGGGSTEILVGHDQPTAAVSIPIGSVRLTERLLHADPPTADELAQLHTTIDAALMAAPALPAGAELVGIAGTVTSLAAMAMQMASYDGDRVHGSRLSRVALDEMVARLATLTVAERRQLVGLDPRRADVILPGAVILQSIMLRAGADTCLVSDRGIRWGLCYESARARTSSAATK